MAGRWQQERILSSESVWHPLDRNRCKPASDDRNHGKSLDFYKTGFRALGLMEKKMETTTVQ